MKVYVVIAVHNRKKYTLNCLSLLEKQTFQNFEVIIVDDGSDDGTSNDIKAIYPHVKIIHGDGSWWWTRSMNEGFKVALDEGADLIITLNNDVSFDENLIQNLIELNEQHPDSLIGCLNLIHRKKPYVFFSGIKKNIWWKAKEVKYHKAFSLLEKDELKGLHHTTCLNGRGTLIPRAVFEKVGLLDELSFPQYASDYDFVLRASNYGFPAFITWDVAISSFIEETGEGKSFIDQSWLAFIRSFFNRYSSTSIRMWVKYYIRHAGIGAMSGVVFQVLRQIYAFKRKRNLLNTLK
ncbi:glycosyltransferase family 2 protein [Carboxylicivirga sp. N1Y90]|uniref:glycosyltransferase family 2 protein n=1 Tax=Carboxylicivirga fragile TaxID=3417571 RepID=UPI003D345E5A|nr:glycosyltransferase family 2 protein [Marinilabiliaceae bacterium N1Y90]